MRDHFHDHCCHETKRGKNCYHTRSTEKKAPNRDTVFHHVYALTQRPPQWRGTRDLA